jgi:acetyl-CoA carboxylase biotin carboxyl carrier protein
MSDETTTGGPDQELLRSVWKEARDLIERLEGSTVQRFRVEAADTAIEIERGLPAGGQAFATPAGALAPGAAGGGEAEPDAVQDGRHPVLAPLVGTFYRASQPGAKPFVEEGDVVDASQTVAIVEAMKIMNQVLAGQEGRVAEIVATDGDWVEFEQVIMYLEPMDE